MKAALSIVLILLLTGCVSSIVPKTRISGTIGNQPFTLESPKDSKMKNLVIEVIGHNQFGDTNFTRIKLESLEANMNPEVITTTAAAQQVLIQTVGQEIRATGQFIGGAVASGGASAVVPK